MGQNLTDPIRALSDSEFQWSDRDRLRLDERYRRRQLRLLRPGPRPPLGDGELGPGEYWPPVGAIVIPLIDPLLHRAPPISSFLDRLWASSLRELVWWEGISGRADRMHATVLVPAKASDEELAATAAESPPLRLRVCGPWVGRYNRGRIYLPVAAVDPVTQATLQRVCRAVGTEPRPLLAGFVQLLADVTGPRYQQLRELIREYQPVIDVEVSVGELRRMETMDDLVLRSTVVRRFELRSQTREAD